MKSASFLCFLKSVFYTINGVVEARRYEREYTTNDENHLFLTPLLLTKAPVVPSAAWRKYLSS